MYQDLAIILLNWNGKKLLHQFLPSVILHSEDAQIHVIDNGSTDDSVSFLQKEFPSVNVIPLNKNYGFCQGYNKGVKQINNTYYVLLNTDVEVTKNWLQSPLSILKGDQSVGICQPKIKSWHDKSLFEYAGAAGGYIDSLGYPFCRGRIFESLEKDTGQYDDMVEVFWASGACLFIKSELFHDIKGFDSGFFAHMEEIDLCWRIKNKGYKIIYTGLSEVFHVGGATLMKSNPKKTYLNFRNSMLYLVKNLPARQFLPKIILRLLLDGIAGVYFACKGEFSHTFAVVKAHASFYVKCWKYYKKDGKGTFNFDPKYSGSIVLDHFAKGKKQHKELKNLKIPNYTPPS
ncbi:MAG: glycosyltransferase family 2 protein [Cyclobacteriaceae bacterium]